MKIYRVLIIVVVISSLFLVACGGGNRARAPQEVFQPRWYGVVSDDETYLFTYGTAVRVSQQAAEASAYSDAMVEAANIIEATVMAMISNFVSEAGYETPEVLQLTEVVARTVANQRFSGAHISERQTFVLDGGRFQHFVRVSVPRSEINRDMMNRIRNEEALYNRFRASQAFEELERVIQGMDALRP